MWSQYSFWHALLPEQQAAWVQAIGSLIAVFTAVLVPMVQRRQELADRRKERGASTASAAIELLPDIRDWIVHLDVVLGTIDAQGEAGMVPLQILQSIPSVAPGPSKRANFRLLASLGDVGTDLSARFTEAIELNDEHSVLFEALTRAVDGAEDELATHIKRIRELRHDVCNLEFVLRIFAVHGEFVIPSVRLAPQTMWESFKMTWSAGRTDQRLGKLYIDPSKKNIKAVKPMGRIGQ